MLETAPVISDVQAAIRRYGGGGPRRIAENAGLVVTHGEGAELVDDTGRRYLDFATAMGVAATGHGHPRWAQAVAEQAHRMAACILHTREHAAYLRALGEVLPFGLDRTALYSGGAEAVEVAVRLAQSVTGKPHLISFATGFHGKTTGVRFTGRRFPQEREWLGIDWVHDIPYPVCIDHDPLTYAGCEDGGDDSLAELDVYAQGLHGEIAAVIVEPVLGTAGNRPPQRHFLRGLRELCDRRGWLLIVDESITGMGRLATLFAAQWFDVRPDILVLGKAMGGGYPLSGVAASSQMWDKSLFAELSATSSSYGANPLACVAGLAVLEVLREDGFLENVSAVGRRLAEGLVQIAKESPYVRGVRGVGMMLGLDLVDPATGAQASAELSQRLFLRLLEEGVLVAQVPAVRLNPPLVLTPADADRALEAMDRALRTA